MALSDEIVHHVPLADVIPSLMALQGVLDLDLAFI